MALDWQPRAVPTALARRYGAQGFWTDEALGHLLVGGLADRPDVRFRIHSTTRPFDGTFAGVLDGALRVAGGLARHGVGPGDVVAFQLPNCVEAALVFYGASVLGALVVPIVHFYGPKEVRYILDRSGARVLVTADRFRGIEFLDLLEAVVGDAPALEHVFVAGEEHGRWAQFSDLADAAAVDEPAAVDPASPALIGWTSGTTADPKGVVHSHRSIVSEIRQLAATRQGPPMLIGAPVGHAIGLLGALLLPVRRGEPVHLIDAWEPDVVLDAMVADGVSAGAGATYFLTTLLDHPGLGPRHVELMRTLGMGGAPVPRAVADRAAALGISLCRFYGSTEHPSTTGATADDPPEKGRYTDGRALPGVELRLVDDEGGDVPTGEAGEILSRGPDLFEGYTDAALTASAFVDDGWYVTGDIGVLDDEGWLTITDRKKDIIIRGGENVSAAEVEELLLRMPGVAEAVVVAAPDARMGEHGCAFLRLLPGRDLPDLDVVRAHLAAAGLARPKWPEELRVADDFPRTASGKVQKFVLRDRLRAEAD